MFGLTSDIFALKARWLPRFLRLPFMKFMLELIQGKNEDIGLPKVTNHILATHPTVNSDLYNAVRHGKVKPKCDIEKFEGKTVFLFLSFFFVDRDIKSNNICSVCLQVFPALREIVW